MDGKASRGAYAQVTAPIGDDPKVHIESGTKSQGTCCSCTRPKLIGAIITAILLLIIIILIIVFATRAQGNKSEKIVGNSTVASSVTEEMMSPTISSMSNGVMMSPTISSMSNGVMMTTQPRPPTTFGPPVAGSFSGAFVMNRMYDQFFDDVRATKTTDFKTNFTMAMDLVFNDANAPYGYVQTDVDALLQNGTNVQVAFTVSLDAINRGGRDHLSDSLGTFPSTTMQTYAVLYANIKAEKEPSLDA